ncbi:MAG: hypothetical protein KGZ79_00385 [Dethiobacter sp.]|nr:hypothetical protein [Dethiobacter sp.]
MDFVEDGILNAQALQEAVNQEISEEFGFPAYFSMTNVQGRPLNLELARRGLMVYGNHTNVPGNRYKNPNAPPGPSSSPVYIPGWVPEYLGYDMLGRLYLSGRIFPPDSLATAQRIIHEMNWINLPWEMNGIQAAPQVKALVNHPNALNNSHLTNEDKRPFDGFEHLKSSIMKAFELGLGRYDNYHYIESEMEQYDWQNYVHITQPPTYYTAGFGYIRHFTHSGNNPYNLPAIVKDGSGNPVVASDLGLTTYSGM